MSAGGLQVASVKRSTSLRMKNLGKVPPRLETLPVVSATCNGNMGTLETYVASKVM